MNKVTPGSNMYQFITHTYNPLAGKCLHACPYCSSNKFIYPVLKEKYSGPIRLDDKEMDCKLGKGNFIFVCGQNDLFAEGIPSEMILRVLIKCYNNSENKYLFQTKNPSRIIEFEHYIRDESIVCTTIETNRDYKINIMGETPYPFDRADGMAQLDVKKFVTIEPIMDFDLIQFVELVKSCNPIQVNIGANSYSKVKLPEPSRDKVSELIDELKQFTEVHLKNNLNRLLS
jgi:hypothetical protein